MRPAVWWSAAARGARPFVIYGLVESAFLIVYRWLLQPLEGYRPLDVTFALACLGFYAATGAAIGIITRAARALAVGNRHGDPAGDPWPGTIAIAVMLVAGAVTYFLGDVVWFDVAYSCFLVAIAAVVVAVAMTGRPRGFGFLAGSHAGWISAALLILPSTTTTFGVVTRGLTVAAVVAWLVGTGWVLQRGRDQHRASGRRQHRRSPLAALVAVSVPAIAICLSSLWLQPTVRSGRGFPGRVASSRPNVVLVMLDTVAAGHLSLYGYSRETSPEIAKIAAGATLFRHAMSTSNYTLASQGSIFTGLYPSEHGARFWDDFGDTALSDIHPVMAQLLADAGYATAGVVANTMFLAPDYGLSRGFVHYDARSPRIMLPRLLPRFSLRRLLFQVADSTPALWRLTREFRPAADITAAASALLDDPAFRAGPFFLLVNYMDAHSPYLPSTPFTGKFETQGGAPDLAAEYDEAVLSEDAAVGALVARLSTLGLADNTLLIIMGDHGESFGEHGDQEHPASLYEPQIHVPLIVKWPHARGGAVVDAPVSGIDILPTVLSAAGLPLPPRGAGRDLSTAPDPLRAIFAEDFYGNADVPKGPRASTAIVIGTRKLLLYEDGQREAFDLGTDPEERHDLYTESDTQWRNMAARLQAALDGWRRTGDRLRPHGAPDRTMIERLRALGYLR